MLDLTQGQVSEVGTVDVKDVDVNEPVIAMVQMAQLKVKTPTKSDPRGYLAINFRFTIMSPGPWLGEDVWHHMNILGYGTNEKRSNGWFLDAIKDLEKILGRKPTAIPTVEAEVENSDIPQMLGQGVVVLLKPSEYKDKWSLAIRTFLSHVDPTDIPVIDLGFTEQAGVNPAAGMNIA